jgi:Rod binding domain-containing protein
MPPEEPKPKNVAEAAQQFEALLIGQMLRNAHDSSAGSLEGESSSTEETMWDLAAQQFAQLLSQKGGLGLARLVQQGLSSKA